MGSYRDMMTMLENYKFLPNALANIPGMQKQMNRGGKKYMSGGSLEPMSSTGGYLSPLTPPTTSSVEDISGRGGGAYEGLNPYGMQGNISHPLIYPQVTAYYTGGEYIEPQQHHQAGHP